MHINISKYYFDILTFLSYRSSLQYIIADIFDIKIF